jgi:ribose/xylose/arabinose/galactoside ABC-type transport system permease subunit
MRTGVSAEESALARVMDRLKLLAALAGIFLFFVLAIGLQGAVRTQRANREMRVSQEQPGTSLAEPARAVPLASPWREGADAAARFIGRRNLETIARQTTIVGIGALGMTLIIILGGIDLSIGSVVAFSTVVIAWCLHQAGAAPNPWEAAALAVAACTLCGFVNGALVTGLRVVPFIVTLGTMLFVRGAAKGLAREQKIDAPETWLNELLASLPAERSWMLVPAGVWLLIVLAVLVALVLRYTRLGRHTFAVGSNEQTARLCGVAVDRVKLWVYTLDGAFGGLAGVMQFSRLTVGDPTVAVGLELDVIAAVVIGGGSLAGGEGSILGSLVGALIMSVIRSGCSQLGLPNWVQEIITGIIIIAAVALDRLRHRRSA